jgi:hypothetical protein
LIGVEIKKEEERKEGFNRIEIEFELTFGPRTGPRTSKEVIGLQRKYSELSMYEYDEQGHTHRNTPEECVD